MEITRDDSSNGPVLHKPKKIIPVNICDEIVRLVKEGVPKAKVAKKFDITVYYVDQIVKKRAYSEVVSN